MLSLCVFMALAQAPTLPPQVSCARVLADIEFLLGVVDASRATLDIVLDKGSPAYTPALEKQLKESKEKADGIHRSATTLIEEQKTRLAAEYRKIPERRDREHFLDKVHSVMFESRANHSALKAVYDDLAKNVEPGLSVSR